MFLEDFSIQYFKNIQYELISDVSNLHNLYTDIINKLMLNFIAQFQLVKYSPSVI